MRVRRWRRTTLSRRDVPLRRWPIVSASFDRPFGHRVSVGKCNFGLLLR
ncbi:hypothetical protein HMPREF0724_14278 [Prescottella equi ATCC 33707]|uniref:Uncharacterized protein n=1 Tax=Prescottella equi ATCC 33707 TaxID=525370 RepID=E9T672_RHOHA|nr:hypothetical protein HMPREF0724_14278 [Prescottella equi ATCC 33707]